MHDSKGGEAKLPWACHDEVHKMPKWKNILKDYFDKFENDCRFIITGSARLDWFRKSGDSLAGRYFIFKFFPLSLSEIVRTDIPDPAEGEPAEAYIERKIEQPQVDQLQRFS